MTTTSHSDTERNDEPQSERVGVCCPRCGEVVFYVQRRAVTAAINKAKPFAVLAAGVSVAAEISRMKLPQMVALAASHVDVACVSCEERANRYFDSLNQPTLPL